MGNDSDPFFWEMALTRGDFLRLLPAAVGQAPFRVQGDEIASDGGPPAWRIRLEERPARAFGPVAIPVLAVTLFIEDARGDEAQSFVARFLLGYQRAGG